MTWAQWYYVMAGAAFVVVSGQLPWWEQAVVGVCWPLFATLLILRAVGLPVLQLPTGP